MGKASLCFQISYVNQTYLFSKKYNFAFQFKKNFSVYFEEIIMKVINFATYLEYMLLKVDENI